jgi:hypothetical protein
VLGLAARQEVEAFRVRGHERVFNPVVDHLHKVSRAGGATGQVPFLGAPLYCIASWRARRGLNAGSECLEDWLEMGHRRGVAANHEAVS